MNKIAFIILLATFITGCDNREKVKDTAQSKKDTLACKDIKIDTSEAKSPPSRPAKAGDTAGQVSKQSRQGGTQNRGVKMNQEVSNSQVKDGKLTAKAGSRYGGTFPQDLDTTKQLPKVLFITTSQGCHCALERCSTGESVIKKIIQPFSQKLSFNQIDYAKERDSVENLARKYQIYSLPALIVLDGEDNFKGKFDFPFEEKLIQEKLKETGVK